MRLRFTKLNNVLLNLHEQSSLWSAEMVMATANTKRTPSTQVTGTREDEKGQLGNKSR